MLVGYTVQCTVPGVPSDVSQPPRLGNMKKETMGNDRIKVQMPNGHRNGDSRVGSIPSP